MSSNTVKCAHCNVVINEVLAFIQSKMDVMDEESIVRLCATSFLEKEIDAAKNLLFDSISAVKKTTRKGDGKNQRNLEDIISTLKRVDPEKIPIFVARELHRLPPVTFDHIDATKLLKDIIWMQHEIKTLKCEFATTEQLNQLRLDLDNIKQASIVNNLDCNINKKRGGYRHINVSSCELDSGPVGVIMNYDTSKMANNCDKRSSDYNLQPSKILTDVTNEHPNYNSKYSTVAIDRNTGAKQLNEPVSNTTPLRKAHASELPIRNECTTVSPNRGTMAEVLRKDSALQHNEVEKGNDWILVQKPKRKNYFKGMVGNANKDTELNFKAAEKRLPIYITNVHKETPLEDITKYILKKTGEKVTLTKLSIKNENKYDAYKIFVPSYTLHMFLNESLWPKGIVFRRFVHYKYRTADKHPDTMNNNDSK